MQECWGGGWGFSVLLLPCRSTVAGICITSEGARQKLWGRFTAACCSIPHLVYSAPAIRLFCSALLLHTWYSQYCDVQRVGCMPTTLVSIDVQLSVCLFLHKRIWWNICMHVERQRSSVKLTSGGVWLTHTKACICRRHALHPLYNRMKLEIGIASVEQPDFWCCLMI